MIPNVLDDQKVGGGSINANTVEGFLLCRSTCCEIKSEIMELSQHFAFANSLVY